MLIKSLYVIFARSWADRRAYTSIRVLLVMSNLNIPFFGVFCRKFDKKNTNGTKIVFNAKIIHAKLIPPTHLFAADLLAILVIEPSVNVK